MDLVHPPPRGSLSGHSSEATTNVPARNLVAVVLWMTGALLSFCAMAVSVRVLAGTLSVMEILALRAGLGLAVMASLAATRADLRATINSRHLPLHLFRNAVHVGSSYLWAMSLLLIPLAMTFALEFTTPAWTLLIAAPVLGERFTASRVGAVVFGLLGVLVILRPGLAAFQPGALLVLTAAFGFAVTLVATKKLTRTDSPFAIIFWMMLIQLPLALIASDPLFVTQAQPGADSRRHRHRRVGPGVALLPHPRVPGRRRRRGGAARFHAHSADRGDRLVALRRAARCVRVSRRRADHHRHPLEPAQRSRTAVEPAQPVLEKTG